MQEIKTEFIKKDTLHKFKNNFVNIIKYFRNGYIIIKWLNNKKQIRKSLRQ